MSETGGAPVLPPRFFSVARGTIHALLFVPTQKIGEEDLGDQPIICKGSDPEVSDSCVCRRKEGTTSYTCEISEKYSRLVSGEIWC